MSQQYVSIKNKRYNVLDEDWIGRKKFFLLKRLSVGERRRFLAFDRLAGPRGSLRIVQYMPRTREAWQRTNVLHRLSERNLELPQLLEFHHRKSEIISIETWIEGRDLRWWIRKMRSSKRMRLGVPESMRLFRQLAHALYHLHKHCGVIHADIKPANIIVSNRTRRLSLIDFGSAWGFERTKNRAKGDGKSQTYCAPEILLDQSGIGFRADYFSLAAVCFETLTLQTAYQGLGSRAALPEFSNERDSLYVPPSEISPESKKLSKAIWKSIDQLMATCLDLDQNSRPENGADWLLQWDRVYEKTKIQHVKPTIIASALEYIAKLFQNY